MAVASAGPATTGSAQASAVAWHGRLVWALGTLGMVRRRDLAG